MTTYTVSTTYNSLPVRGYLSVPDSAVSVCDAVVIFHPTIETQTTPDKAATAYLNFALDPTVLDLGDRILFSVAYPQDAIPGWTQAQASALFPGINLSTFYFGDNVAYASAALQWALTSLDSYLASLGIAKTRNRIFIFGHSQGAYLAHRLNTMHTVDGVVCNAPGPIDLLARCQGSEAQGDDNVTCSRLKAAFGSTSTNPTVYDNLSLKSFLNGSLAPALYTQALDDSELQVTKMKTVLEPGLKACTTCKSFIFRYYQTGGHAVFATNNQAQIDIRQFLTNLTVPNYSPVSELQSASPSAVIELFELQLNSTQHGINDVYRFHAGANMNNNGEIVWASNNYLRFPVEAEGFEYSGNGQLPRPKLRVSNVLNTITALILSLPKGLEGAKVTRIRTLARYLDNANWPGGNPSGTPQPDAEFPREIYYIDRKTTETLDVVEYELAAVFDLAGIRAPKRQCLGNICSWVYRSAECGYTGSAYFDANDRSVPTLVADECGKRLSSCKVRFGSTAELPFGGYPGIGTYFA